jgi:hypothetical protein
VRQSSSFRVRPGISTLAEQASAESVLRLLPSLKPLVWQSLSAPSLQSGAPFAETGQTIRPLTIEDGLVRRDKLSEASFAASRARAFKILDGLLRTFEGRKFLEHPSDFVEKARILLARWGRRHRCILLRHGLLGQRAAVRNCRQIGLRQRLARGYRRIDAANIAPVTLDLACAIMR